ncbi:MAG: hypothetical protein JWP37_3028, partial [Mucilaginibacter sp.]|nr:hypothetical protein [Mucilaginibacter sp.]
TVLRWYNGSDIQEKISEINTLNKESEKLKRITELAKKQLSTFFNR